MRIVESKEYAHERLGDRFETALSNYDTQRRVETLVDDFLTDDMVRGKKTLDVGCGLGFFSERLHQRGADVTACDLGPNLVERTVKRVGCKGVVADALALVDQFGPESFDLVVSSECVEHTPSPERAIAQMLGLLKKGGVLSISTPNLLWSPVVKAATWLKLRPFDGYENFISWREIRRNVVASEATIIREEGLHLYPFQFGVHSLSTWLDRSAQPLRGLMINMCILARKG